MNIIVGAAQYPISNHRTFEDWKNHTENWIKSAADQHAGIVLFPEYGSMELVSLFPYEIQQNIQEQVLEMQNLYADFCEVFASLSKKYRLTIITPSFPVAVGNQIFNRVGVFDSQGMAGFQDKFFMTRFENEEWGIHSAPKTLTLFESDWGNFGIQTCYDIEFAIGSHILCHAGADLIFAPSCTETIRGATRVHIGARARAMENQCYVAVAQTVGNATWSPAVDINFGFAGIYSTPDIDFPEEGMMAKGKPQEEKWLITELDVRKIKNVRQNGQVLNFKDHLQLEYGVIEDKVQITRKVVI